jgi:hypothetical protein
LTIFLYLTRPGGIEPEGVDDMRVDLDEDPPELSMSRFPR